MPKLLVLGLLAAISLSVAPPATASSSYGDVACFPERAETEYYCVDVVVAPGDLVQVCVMKWNAQGTIGQGQCVMMDGGSVKVEGLP